MPKQIQQLSLPIAEGRTAEIYAWEPGWLLKLYRDWVPPEDAAHEARVTKAAHASGFAAPAVGDTLQIGGRTGLLLEHVEGVDMLAVMLRQPWRTSGFARQMADLHLRMHACQPNALPDLHERLDGRLRSAPGLPAQHQAALLDRLAQLPIGDALTHGDLHPLNVIMKNGALKVIDWVDAKRGNPLADVARSTVLLTIGGLPPNPIQRLFIQLFRQRFHDAYLQRYFAGHPEKKPEYGQWLPIMAAARLTEGIEEDNPHLLAAIDRWLEA